MNKVPKLRFPEFQEEWEEKKLGDLLDFKNGINASKEQYGKGIKFINVLDILNNNYIVYENIIGKVDINEETLDKNAVSYGDVLFQRSSETREEVGTANVYLDKEKKATFGGFIIRGKKIGEYNPIFINKLLKTSFARREITTRSGGSTRYNVGQDVLTDIKLLFPSMMEQDKIASFFSLVDEKIEKQQQKVEALEEYNKGMMQKIFSQEIRFKEENGNEFPKWEKRCFGELFYEPKKEKVKKPHEKQLLTVKLHCKGIEATGNYPNKTENGRPYFQRFKGELLIGRQNLHNGGIGIVSDECNGLIASNAISSYINKEGINLHFIYYQMSQMDFYKRIDLLIGGTGQKEISKAELEKIYLLVPIKAEQDKIADILSNLERKILYEKEKLKELKQWKKGFLQQMFI